MQHRLSYSTHLEAQLAQVIDIVEALKSFDAPVSSIVNSMTDVKHFSGQCVVIAKNIYTSFEKWSELTKELWASCTNETAHVEQRQKALDEKLSYFEELTKGQDKQVEEMKKAVDDMKHRMDDANKDYKQSLEDIPGA